jgi:hypothetical protein
VDVVNKKFNPIKPIKDINTEEEQIKKMALVF